MKRIISLILIIVLSAIIFASCEQAPEPNIVGKWEQEHDGDVYFYIFEENGVMRSGIEGFNFDMEGTYTLNGNILNGTFIKTFTGKAVEAYKNATVTVEGDKMTVKQGNATIVYTKAQ